MLYKKLVSLGLVGLLSLGALVGCQKENQEIKELQEQVTKLEQQIEEQKNTENEEKEEVVEKETETKTKKEEAKKEESQEMHYRCLWCNVWHSQSESYYNKDGLSWCSKECYDTYNYNYENPTAEATKCDNCGTNNIEVMDSAGGYICNECGHWN